MVPHPVWLIILSTIVARSTHIEGQFYFEIYFSGITPLDTYNVTHHKELRVCDMPSNVASEHFWFYRLFGTFHKCVLYPNVFHNASSYLAGQEVVFHSWNKCIS